MRQCLACGCPVDPDEAEPVPGMNQYRHASWEECSRALENASVSMHAEYVKKHKGRVPQHRTLDQIEDS